MENLKDYGVMEMTLIDQNKTDGGFWIGPPPQWVIDAAIAIEKAVDAYVKGFKSGSEIV
jgi:hypothetical protein